MITNEEIEAAIITVTAAALARPNEWLTIDQPMTYNRYMRLKEEYPDLDFTPDEGKTEALKTPQGNSSGSRLVVVLVFNYQAAA